MLKILYRYILRMLAKWEPMKAGPSVMFYSSSVSRATAKAADDAAYHQNLLNKAGANRGGKRKKKRKGGRKKGGSKTCGCSGVPIQTVSYPTGSSSAMSPNPNDNLAAAQQLMANTLCAGSLDNMGDSWSQGGGRKRKRTRRKTKRKKKKTKTRKRRKTKRRKRKRSSRKRKR
jgi:hypothetical protein